MSKAYITQPEDISDRLCLSLVNFKKNEVFLKTKPYIKKGSMAVISLLKISDNMFLPITNEMVEKWDIPIDRLFQMSKENANKILPVKVEPLEKLIEQPKERLVYNFSLDESCNLADVLMISTEAYSLGAASIFAEPHKLNEIADVYEGADIYLFPICSEFTFAMPATSISIEDAKEIFENLTDIYELAKEDCISDSILMYNMKDNVITEYGDMEYKYNCELKNEDVITNNKHNIR